MLDPDTDTRRALVRERHAELRRDWQRPSAEPPRAAAARRHRRLRLSWLRTRLRPIGHFS